MNPQLVREIGGVVLAFGAAVLIVILGVTLGMDGEWGRFGLLGGALVLAAAAVWAMRYDAERAAMRRLVRAERRVQAGRAAQGDPRPVRMPSLPPRDTR